MASAARVPEAEEVCLVDFDCLGPVDELETFFDDFQDHSNATVGDKHPINPSTAVPFHTQGTSPILPESAGTESSQILAAEHPGEVLSLSGVANPLMSMFSMQVSDLGQILTMKHQVRR